MPAAAALRRYWGAGGRSDPTAAARDRNKPNGGQGDGGGSGGGGGAAVVRRTELDCRRYRRLAGRGVTVLGPSPALWDGRISGSWRLAWARVEKGARRTGLRSIISYPTIESDQIQQLWPTGTVNHGPER